MSATTYLCKGMLTLDAELRLRESCVKARWNSRLPPWRIARGTLGKKNQYVENGSPALAYRWHPWAGADVSVPRPWRSMQFPSPHAMCRGSSRPRQTYWARRTTRPSGRVSAWPLWRTALAGQDEWKSGCLPRIKPALCYVRSWLAGSEQPATAAQLPFRPCAVACLCAPAAAGDTSAAQWLRRPVGGRSLFLVWMTYDSHDLFVCAPGRSSVRSRSWRSATMTHGPKGKKFARRASPASVWKCLKSMIDSLLGWLIDWLIDWLMDCPTDCLIDWLIDWLVDWWISWEVDHHLTRQLIGAFLVSF